MQNCQVNFNAVADSGGDRFNNNQAGLMIGMDLQGSGFVVENCQLSNNRMDGLKPYTAVDGLDSHG